MYLEVGPESNCNLRVCYKFQAEINLRNFTTPLQNSRMARCEFDKRQEWMLRSRSNTDGVLTLAFLADMAACLQVDVAHALSRTVYEGLDTEARAHYRINRPAPATTAMFEARAPLVNTVDGDEKWQVQVSERLPLMCVNPFKHNRPAVMLDEEKFLSHRETCAPVAGPSGLGKRAKKMARKS